LAGTKKLQDLFVDAHVTRELRDCIPIFTGDDGILWVAGMRRSAGVVPGAGEARIILSCAPAPFRSGRDLSPISRLNAS